MKKKFLLIFLIFSFLFLISASMGSSENESAEQYAQSLGIEKSAIKIISRLDRDNQFDELEKDFITWLASQDKESQFKLAFKYAFDGEISASEISEILSTPINKNIESEKTSSPESKIEYLMLDDFENKKITEENRWSLGKRKILHGNVSEQNVYIDTKTGVEKNGSSLCMEYSMPAKDRIMENACMTSSICLKKVKKDLANFDGISFFVKATDTKKRYYLHIVEVKGSNKEQFYFSFSLNSNEWTKIMMPFNKFIIDGDHGINSILEINNILGFTNFEVCDTAEDPGGKGKVWIDKIALYKETKNVPLKANIKREVIFDFEDEIRNEYGKWNIGITENVCGTGTIQKIYVDPDCGANNTTSSLCTEVVEMTQKRDGAEVEIHPELKVKNLDLAQYSGIGFFIKTSCLSLPIHLNFIEGRRDEDEEVWQITFNPSDNWTEIIIPFNSLNFCPSRNTINQKLDLSKISEISIGQWGSSSEVGEKFKIWIDEICLYKGDIKLSIGNMGEKQIAVYRAEDSQALSFSIEDLPKSKKLALHEALYYQKLSGNTVQCEICPNRCTLAEGEVGDCNNRKNIDGKLYTLVYSQPCALTVDPIEKGPMFHMKPGMRTLALGTAGCNLKCKNCQNWQFTQVGPEETVNYRLSPQEAINLARKYNCEAIVFTYNDPIVSYEYVLEMAKLAKKNNLKTIMITAGYINPEPLRELCQYMDAIKIDLKGFTNEFYQKVCRATLQPVLDSIKIIKEEGVWLEIVNLVIPSFNDNSSEIKAMCNWIKDNVGTDVPLHFSRFWHSYKLENMETTPVSTLENAFSIATAAGLNYIYIGNVPGHPKGNTYCPHCGKLLIERIGFLAIGQNNIMNGKCKFCGEKIAGVW